MNHPMTRLEKDLRVTLARTFELEPSIAIVWLTFGPCQNNEAKFEIVISGEAKLKAASEMVGGISRFNQLCLFENYRRFEDQFKIKPAFAATFLITAPLSIADMTDGILQHVWPEIENHTTSVEDYLDMDLLEVSLRGINDLD